ncbi:thioredoxin family protein [Pseudomonas sp. 148P]|uniref:Thioredoxin family protein n=1 Tax=Pseudomonas ulcerans TaxID=3115852 RepID=A0ABU7HTK6_9PSED|nr:MULTISPECIES: thioredoxin family protein [unclassified Pseudomonas]MEE1923281.1 thioredoxin family protein [Pseudomonas sp. 147P]MEE1934844.1 thioredoxin family protein [Pseudomonas sp. 148P]
MNNDRKHPVVTRREWLGARRQLLLHEKAFTHQRDELSAARRALPWVKVEQDYRFAAGAGELDLAELFDGRSQLLVYHFMFADGWEEGCPGCSFLADHFDGANLHLAHHDVSLVAVSRAPFAQFQAFRQRMGWKFPWVSSHGSSFNHDFGVTPAAEGAEYNYEPYTGDETELPGLSVFYRDEAGDIFHTYSSYARGLDILVGTYNFLDLMPKGRNEEGTMDWVRHHDRYEGAEEKKHCCH